MGLAKTVAQLVGGVVPTKEGRPNHGKSSAPLSQTYYMPEKPTIESRRVAIIVTEGFNFDDFANMVDALKAARAFPYIIGTKRSFIKAQGKDSSQGVKPDHHLEGLRSTLVDAIYIPGGDHVATLRQTGRAVHWVREAFAHCKAIGATGSAVDLVRDACSGISEIKLSSTGAVEAYGVVTASHVTNPEAGKAVAIKEKSGDFLGEFFYSIAMHRCYARETDGLVKALAY